MDNNKFDLDALEKLASNFDGVSSKKVILFNKNNGAYFSTLINPDVSKLDAKLFKWKEVNFNGKTHTWDEGDYGSGKVIALEEQKTLITEANVNALAKKTIVEEYPEHKQANIIMNVIQKIIIENNVSGKEADEFTAMSSYIAARRSQNAKYKDAYSKSEDHYYLSRDDQFQRNVQAVKGDIEDKFQIAVEREI
tara:strand:+ start:1365 stop:1946 length:582 start_codon:yes stop_codon:yes gene_type:complete